MVFKFLERKYVALFRKIMLVFNITMYSAQVSIQSPYS